MTWEHKSLGEICRQLKDVNLNGGRELAFVNSRYCRSTSPKTTSSPGRGIPAKAVNLLPEIRRLPEN
jgi:hypothetical protein